MFVEGWQRIDGYSGITEAMSNDGRQHVALLICPPFFIEMQHHIDLQSVLNATSSIFTTNKLERTTTRLCMKYLVVPVSLTQTYIHKCTLDLRKLNTDKLVALYLDLRRFKCKTIRSNVLKYNFNCQNSFIARLHF